MDPQRIADRYDVIRAIGRGGMGTVWLCRDTVLNREVAVKQIGAMPGESENETRRAMREARSAAALNHPNAVAVYDVVDYDDRPWLVMEYVEGETLADVIAREGHLEPRRVADIGAHLASAMARAHERGIVHRDIKPGNVLIDRGGRPKISDFGIARGLGDDALTQTGFVSGTPGYLSPELARGEDPDAASDVWALGATLYAAVEGRPPFAPRSNPIAVLQAIATQPPEPMEHAGAIGGAIAAMMDAEPSSRWDMATAAERLAAVARGETTLPLPAAAGGAAAAGAAAGATQVMSSASEPTQAMPAPVPAEAVAPAAAAAYGSSRPGPPGPAAEPGDDDRAGSRRWLPLLLVALLLAGLGGAYLLTRGDNNPGAAPPAGTTTTTATKPQTTSDPKTSTTSKPATSSPTSASSTSAPTTSSAPSQTKPSDQQLEKFVRGYFRNVTEDRDQTWPLLTAKMQAAAGGRSGYESFWSGIDTVKVGNLQADAQASTATAQLTYQRTDGTKSTETKRFTFVEEGGSYKIDSERAAG